MLWVSVRIHSLKSLGEATTYIHNMILWRNDINYDKYTIIIWSTVVPKFSDASNFAVIHLKFKQMQNLKTCKCKWNSSEDEQSDLGLHCLP